jgi:C-terminal processing protease CtpA/Prc
MKLLLLTSCIILATYYGGVSVGHGKPGRIGIKYDPVRHQIVHVYRHTPAAEADLKPGDIILHVNAADITGEAFTFVNLTIKRKNVIFNVEIERIPNEWVHEQQEAPDTEIDPRITPKTA